jgi:lysophospholipase L1-like esterase
MMTPIAASTGGSNSPLSRFHRRIQEKTVDRSVRAPLIVALGDSVTQGVAAVDQFLHEEVYHRQFAHLLEQKHPTCIFNTINAGVDGQTTRDALVRLDRDVLPHRPDLLLVAFGLNDAVQGGLEKLDDYQANIEAIIHRTRREAECDIILLTPNMMLSRDNVMVAPQHRHLVHQFLEIQNGGVLAAYAQRLRQIGRDQNIPIADLYTAWETLAQKGTDTTAMLSNGLNHPTAEGHRMAAQVLMSVMDEFPSPCVDVVGGAQTPLSLTLQTHQNL